MPRMRILSAIEQEQFEKPPVFNSSQRKKFFDFPKALLETAQKFRKPAHQVGFLLSCGYFNAAKRFFAPGDYHQRDIDYVVHRMKLPSESFDAASYADRTRQRHEHIVLQFYGFKRFDKTTECLITQEIASMVQSNLKPKLIFLRCIDRAISQHIQVPNFHRLSNLILSAFNQRKRDLATLIEHQLNAETKAILDALFVQMPAADANATPAKTTRYKLTLLKKQSQSTKPAKIKERVDDLAYLSELHAQLTPVLTAMNLNHEGIRYYAVSVIKSRIFQLNQRSNEDRLLAAIITHSVLSWRHFNLLGEYDFSDEKLQDNVGILPQNSCRKFSEIWETTKSKKSLIGMTFLDMPMSCFVPLCKMTLPCKGPGRPRTVQEIIDMVIRMARERSGYDSG